MKNTFNTIRKKVRSKQPYLVIMNNKIKYLFEVTQRTSLKEILSIEEKFNDDEIIFATIDQNFTHYSSTIDAANLYEVGNRKKRTFLYYDKGTFYKTEEKVYKSPLDSEYTRLLATDKIQPIALINNLSDFSRDEIPAPGINIKIISQDDDCDVDMEELIIPEL